MTDPNFDSNNQYLLDQLRLELVGKPKWASAALVFFSETNEIRYVWDDDPNAIEKIAARRNEGLKVLGLFTMARDSKTSDFHITVKAMDCLTDKAKEQARQIINDAAHHCCELEWADDPPRVVVVPYVEN
jgi:hypothetical protein